MNMNSNFLPKILATMALVIVATATHAQADQTVFVMSAIENEAAGDAILAGEYAVAADTILTRSRIIGDNYSKETNLCVSLTLDGQIESAEAHCESALRHSRVADRISRRLSDSRAQARLYRAVALSNRGVLRGVSGDLDGAQSDFERAAALSAAIDNADRNLQHLETLRQRLSAR